MLLWKWFPQRCQQNTLCLATTWGHPQGWEYPLTLSHGILVNKQEGHMAGALFIYFTGQMLAISVHWNARIGPQEKKMLQDPGLERYKSKSAWYLTDHQIPNAWPMTNSPWASSPPSMGSHLKLVRLTEPLEVKLLPLDAPGDCLWGPLPGMSHSCYTIAMSMVTSLVQALAPSLALTATYSQLLKSNHTLARPLICLHLHFKVNFSGCSNWRHTALLNPVRTTGVHLLTALWCCGLH